ncbi:Hsp70 family protein [Caballeronia sp. LZ019]|uniref:Hsp70 family protein n=1 Tax=Caballeronia sp. LZ019 TaxID=3038555 RepID=UPI00285BC746|nr:Hsp70 family protein [Caballeronia sp. LZ019]MDR5808168.1 hsp70 family protein [Caballeronia sp. LZ019]
MSAARKQKPAQARYRVGIDLGTSNTVVAYARAGSGDIRIFEIDQLVAAGEVAAQPLLPSLRYHFAPGELRSEDLQLPWGEMEAPAVIGRFARTLGAQVPGRLVSSAKSWLSHAAVDRLAPILPWGAGDDIEKISPVIASASYLAHVHAAWNERFPEAPLDAQDVVLTVPASFDEGARALTLEAAKMAGLETLRLLEEPQAAFYDWLFHHRETLGEELAATRLVLICDVGGGTTDLTLIQVEPNNIAGGEPVLTRIGVGNHLMLGGDNMDLALAHLVEKRLAGDDGRLSAGRLSQLVERCRAAKEQLLGEHAPASVSITLLGAGSKLIGGARSAEVTREEIERIIVEGFFPLVSGGERPGRARGGIVEFGLPYASDPAITRHVAAFLAQHATQAREALSGDARAEAARTSEPQASQDRDGDAAANAANAGNANVAGNAANPNVAGTARNATNAGNATNLNVAGNAANTTHTRTAGNAAIATNVTHATNANVPGNGKNPEKAANAEVAGNASKATGARDTAQPAAYLPVPDTLLLNGGVFRAAPLARRIADTLGKWRGAPVHVLANDHPDVAVARGAVAYALARAGNAPKIGGGSARSYFLLLDEEGDATRGVCVLPRGTEEGQPIHLADRTFALRLGAPVRFHLVSSVADTAYKAGDIADVSASAGDFVRLPPIATVVDARGETRGGPSGSGPRETPVHLTTSLTEVGTLEMHCIAIDDPAKRWLLEFQLRREEPDADAAASQTPAQTHPALPKAIELIDRTFGTRAQDVGPKEVKRLRAQLEQALGPRDTWDIALLRELFGALWDRAKKRRRTADHERLWLNLAGYCMRPGFGHPLDEWRVEQLWTLFDQGIQYVNENQIWSEWWTLWRRAAGGLDEAAQLRLLDDMAFVLQPPGASRYRRAAGAARAGYEDMVRLAASLERVPVERKVEAGEWLLTRLKKPSENLQSWWAVGRIGARQPFYGSAHGVVPPDIAEAWLAAILALDWKKVEPAAFAAVQIARMTGDRSRDVSDEVRAAVIERLTTMGAAQSWIAMVRETVALDRADEGRVFGETLPAGLKLIG